MVFSHFIGALWHKLGKSVRGNVIYFGTDERGLLQAGAAKSIYAVLGSVCIFSYCRSGFFARKSHENRPFSPSFCPYFPFCSL